MEGELLGCGFGLELVTVKSVGDEKAVVCGVREASAEQKRANRQTGSICLGREGETAELGSTDRDLQLYPQYFFKTF